jgi:hypothetical protein
MLVHLALEPGISANEILSGKKNSMPRCFIQSARGSRYSPADRSSPKNAYGAISATVLTPVTASNSGFASGCLFGHLQPALEKSRAERAPQSPPLETIRASITGGG